MGESLGLLRRNILLVVAMFSARIAEAEPRAAHPALSYRAPSHCPSAEAFARQVGARTAVWARGSSGTSVRVEIERAGEALTGRMTLVRDGRVTDREVHAEHCPDVVAALALIVAILLDPDADTRPLLQVAPAPPGPAVPGPAAPLPARPAPVATAPPAHRWVLAGGVELALESAAAQNLVIGPRWFAGFSRGPRGAWPSSFRFSASSLQSAERLDGVVASAFQLRSLRADVCAVELQRANLKLEPCAFLEAGRLVAIARGPSGSDARNVDWLAGGGFLRGSWTNFDVLVLQAELGAVLPLRRYVFRFDEEHVIHETPILGMSAGFGVGVCFP